MKILKLVLTSFICIALINCGKKKEEVKPLLEVKEIVKPTPVVEKNELKIQFSLITDEDDLFQVVFASLDYETKQIIRYTELKKSNDIQEFSGVIDLDKESFPEEISLILGHRKEKRLIINKILLKTLDNEIEIHGNELTKHFIFNSYVEYDEVLGGIVTKEINKNLLPIIALRKATLDSLY